MHLSSKLIFGLAQLGFVGSLGQLLASLALQLLVLLIQLVQARIHPIEDAHKSAVIITHGPHIALMPPILNLRKKPEKKRQ